MGKFRKKKEMNKITRSLLTYSCICLLTLSCKNAKTEEKNKPTNVQDSTVVTENNTNIVSDKQSDSGFELMRTESLGKLKLELGTTKIKELFGEPEEKTKSEIWEVDGEYRQDWKYPTKGIELTLKGEFDSTRTVEMITIKKPCELKTKKLIGIGSEYEKVRIAYKDKIDKSASNTETLVVGSIYGGLIFNFEDKKVKSIFIGASAE